MTIDRLASALSDRYRLERKLGAGGMATVYLAQDLKHQRKVALKVLHPELAAALGSDRFLAEIRTTANLQHPNIVPLFDSGEADGFVYYVMPYVTGESLREKLEREGRLEVPAAVAIAHAHAPTSRSPCSMPSLSTRRSASTSSRSFPSASRTRTASAGAGVK
jgi:eukaryotic-like serine/threonine-protein kinase